MVIDMLESLERHRVMEVSIGFNLRRRDASVTKSNMIIVLMYKALEYVLERAAVVILTKENQLSQSVSLA
jgi:hypothetical protein